MNELISIIKELIEFIIKGILYFVKLCWQLVKYFIKHGKPDLSQFMLIPKKGLSE